MRRLIVIVTILAFLANGSLAAVSQSDKDFLKSASLVTGGLLAGEAIFLLIGMNFTEENNRWATPKNNWLALSDLLTGLGMIYQAQNNQELYDSQTLYFYSSLSTLTHTYRECEYFKDKENKFCTNMPLFVMNNIKLLGSLVVTGRVLALRVSW